MKRLMMAGVVLALGLIVTGGPARAEKSYKEVAKQVNNKMVKLFGAGGLKGLADYGTGVVISSDGYILTVYSHILDTQDLRVHTAVGDRYHAKVVAIEPELDVALVKIDPGKGSKLELEYFDVVKAAQRPLAEPGTTVLAFSNQFKIADRNEPMSVQRGMISSYSKLFGRIGIFQAAYRGNVYVIDAITNNPGAGGGVITTRKGELLGLIGKELRNELTNTWINYAVPIGATIKVQQADDKTVTASILDLIEKKEKYRQIVKKAEQNAGGGYTGLVLIDNVVELTPPYVDEVEPNSPAALAKIQPDDLIVYVDGQPVVDVNTFREVMNHYRPGMKIQLEVQRGNKLNTVMITLEKPRTPAPKK
jgi:S1-C subfamily serine protease